ncbi:MAG: hypothetical protein NW241_12560 [Bacteroidia bacterium]|nr:hypothetical protein [Bacteroidia bacterium]
MKKTCIVLSLLIYGLLTASFRPLMPSEYAASEIASVRIFETLDFAGCGLSSTVGSNMVIVVPGTEPVLVKLQKIERDFSSSVENEKLINAELNKLAAQGFQVVASSGGNGPCFATRTIILQK